ncbi:FRIGIDA-like protein 4b [Camellia lanceoleosa]|uniref:FRIGIDA-like protein 4b n=1 Tax=Camellia lanceoleosa TaxID=1840588 RepID=A0ACC0FY15_9ERIC|nr:FRIGIDA-like protein 4b [Camellia lanceoleosa]
MARKRELDPMRAQMSIALADCINLTRFILEAISEVFSVNNRSEKSERLNDLGWSCVLILELLILVVIDWIYRPTDFGVRLVTVRMKTVVWDGKERETESPDRRKEVMVSATVTEVWCRR